MDTTAIEGSLLQVMTEEVAGWVDAKGWNNDRSFGDEIALLHSEVSEALEAWRKRGFERWASQGPDQMVGEVVPDGSYEYDGQPQGVASEYADVLIRLLDDCGRHGIDLMAEYRAKMKYNWTRTYRHGDKNL